MDDNFPKLMKDIKLRLQRNLLQTPRKIRAKRTTLSHVLLKLLKMKYQEDLLKLEENNKANCL